MTHRWPLPRKWETRRRLFSYRRRNKILSRSNFTGKSKFSGSNSFCTGSCPWFYVLANEVRVSWLPEEIPHESRGLRQVKGRGITLIVVDSNSVSPRSVSFGVELWFFELIERWKCDVRIQIKGSKNYSSRICRPRSVKMRSVQPASCSSPTNPSNRGKTVSRLSNSFLFLDSLRVHHFKRDVKNNNAK